MVLVCVCVHLGASTSLMLGKEEKVDLVARALLEEYYYHRYLIQIYIHEELREQRIFSSIPHTTLSPVSSPSLSMYLLLCNPFA